MTNTFDSLKYALNTMADRIGEATDNCAEKDVAERLREKEKDYKMLGNHLKEEGDFCMRFKDSEGNIRHSNPSCSEYEEKGGEIIDAWKKSRPLEEIINAASQETDGIYNVTSRGNEIRFHAKKGDQTFHFSFFKLGDRKVRALTTGRSPSIPGDVYRACKKSLKNQGVKVIE
jgi:hypothetical protein